MQRNATVAPIQMSRENEGSRRPHSPLDTTSIQLLRRLVPRQHQPLVLRRILLPQLGRLSIEGTRTAHVLVLILPPLSILNHSLIRLPQQTLQTQQHRPNIVHGTPLILQNIEANAAAHVDVGVVDGRLEEHRRRRHGVRGAELHAELEDEVGVGRVGGPVDGRRPERHVFVVREGGDAGGGVRHYVHELFLETVRGHYVSWGWGEEGGGDVPLGNGGIAGVCAGAG
jgi:hypothetical protein